ncbi:proline iminopeptidase [Prauserella sediminis]|uniref:Proline iminopeptidase n=1 Tax=Prauserella sediminis TaxID=577680 RepID=A0A839XSB9_9PSEU|nr:prolyl aminopeptidase [Prauserella sediminis]MBB3666080.1 proline iminopeptidase [Prauserella sediminis]
MRELYPHIEPHATGMLPVGEGHELYWEECGNPAGKPVVFLHGGPGSGCRPGHRRMFDPERYRIVLFDQRGAGRSTPNAGRIDADLTSNTTWHLVDDMESLRTHLDVDRWQVFGGSWGSTLALAYAEQHPDRVTELVLRGVFTARRKELDWSFRGSSAFLFPDRFEQLLEPVPHDERGDLIEAYHRLLSDPDESVRRSAAISWAQWEADTAYLRPNQEFVTGFTDPDHAAALARIEVHYFRNLCFLEDGQLLRDAHRLAGIPGVIAQGRYDVVTPPVSAWDLHRAWPDSDLVIVPDAGHAFDEPGTLEVLLDATDRFAPD